MGKGRFITIWDGVQYRHVSPQEADRLVEKDMAQKMPVDGTAMKFRKDFSGYQTREVRPAKPEPPVVVTTVRDWKDYRRAAAEHLDQPIMSTSKKQTKAYMEQELGIQDQKSI